MMVYIHLPLSSLLLLMVLQSVQAAGPEALEQCPWAQQVPGVASGASEGHCYQMLHHLVAASLAQRLGGSSELC